MNPGDIENRFSYHRPDADRVNLHGLVRDLVKHAALALDLILPEGREKSLAITKLEEAMFWSNAAVARNQ